MRKRILAITMALAAAFMMTTSISSLAAAETTANTEKATEEKEVAADDKAATEEIIGEVTEEKALEIALKHADYTKEEAEEVKIEKSDEDGNPVYEVEFYVGVSKFDYEIEIATGKILEYEIDD